MFEYEAVLKVVRNSFYIYKVEDYLKNRSISPIIYKRKLEYLFFRLYGNIEGQIIKHEGVFKVV